MFFLFSHIPFFLFLFIDPATTGIYTLSLHDALPIFGHMLDQARTVGIGDHVGQRHERRERRGERDRPGARTAAAMRRREGLDRKSTRLNSSHANISYAVFCLKKKKTKTNHKLPQYVK